jgi:hypothetical protein
MSKFNDRMSRGNLVAIAEMGDPVTIEGVSMLASLDSYSQDKKQQQGRMTAGAEFVLFVSKAAFVAASGKEGSYITMNGKESRILKIGDDQDGILELQCGPFKGVKV